jgi:hypothetical protein
MGTACRGNDRWQRVTRPPGLGKNQTRQRFVELANETFRFGGLHRKPYRGDGSTRPVSRACTSTRATLITSISA